MRKLVLICTLLLGTLAPAGLVHAQDTKMSDEAARSSDTASHFYRLTFLVEEVAINQKPVNSRTYTTTVNTNPHFKGQIRTGSRIPVPTGPTGAPGPTQFQYVDTGINFDISSVAEIDRQLSLNLSAVISSVADTRDPALRVPVIRENRWSAAVLIPIGKPSLVFTSDALDSPGSLHVTMTATPLP